MPPRKCPQSPAKWATQKGLCARASIPHPLQSAQSGCISFHDAATVHGTLPLFRRAPRPGTFPQPPPSPSLARIPPSSPSPFPALSTTLRPVAHCRLRGRASSPGPCLRRPSPVSALLCNRKPREYSTRALKCPLKVSAPQCTLLFPVPSSPLRPLPPPLFRTSPRFQAPAPPFPARYFFFKSPPNTPPLLTWWRSRAPLYFSK